MHHGASSNSAQGPISKDEDFIEPWEIMDPQKLFAGYSQDYDSDNDYSEDERNLSTSHEPIKSSLVIILF